MWDEMADRTVTPTAFCQLLWGYSSCSRDLCPALEPSLAKSFQDCGGLIAHYSRRAPCMQTRPSEAASGPSSRTNAGLKHSRGCLLAHGFTLGHFMWPRYLPCCACTFSPSSLSVFSVSSSNTLGDFVLTSSGSPEPWLDQPWLGFIGCKVLFQTSLEEGSSSCSKPISGGKNAPAGRNAKWRSSSGLNARHAHRLDWGTNSVFIFHE